MSTQILYPADVLNLDRWKLTMTTPIGGTKPLEVKQPALDQFNDKNYFYVTGSGENREVIFKARVDGAHTPNSTYSRTELREMEDSAGQTNAAWSNRTSGTHVLRVVGRVTALPKNKPELVIAQIHDDEDDVCMVRAEKNRVFLETSRGTVTYKDGRSSFDESYAVGQTVTVNITVVKGKIVVYYRRSGESTVSAVLKYAGTGMYFKTGAYVQSNLSYDKPGAAGTFRLKSLELTHEGI